MQGETTGGRSWQDVVRTWPQENQEQVRYFADKYGQPTSVCDDWVYWENAGPWKRTVVYAQQWAHDFPQPHKDIIKQTIDYRVPTNKIADLIEFDGSLIYDRTLGELSARCGNERMSCLGFNLADQIVAGQTDVQGARRKAADAIEGYMRGRETPSIMQGLQFQPQYGAADPDHSMSPLSVNSSMGSGPSYSR